MATIRDRRDGAGDKASNDLTAIVPTVTEWYYGGCVFLTGATGFVGKVLLERLLITLPVAKVFVLLRPKKGVAPQARLQDILALPLFDALRRQQPDALRKVEALAGDLEKEGLGLSEDNRRRLLRDATVVFHSAASVRLESNMSAALRDNTRSTRRMLDLARQMPNLKAFVHVSTAFCHPELEVLEERVYDSPAPPKEVLALEEWMDDRTLDSLAPSLLGHHPNCYTFTKRLSEKLVDEERSRMPVLIIRPSIVVPALGGSVPGWVDSLNGPVGVMIGAGRGVIRSIICDKQYAAEVIPVDIAANAAIICAWDASVNKAGDKETPVYNVSTGEVLRLSWGELITRWYQQVLKNPFEGMLWYPQLTLRTCEVMHKLIVIFFQFMPAYFIDFLLMLFMQKPFMVRLQKRIASGVRVLRYFILRSWLFRNNKLLEVEERLGPQEKETFYISQMPYDIDDYFHHFQLGARKFCQNQSPETLPRSRTQLTVLYVLDLLARIVFFTLMVYILTWSLNPIRYMLDIASTGLVTKVIERIQ